MIEEWDHSVPGARRSRAWLWFVIALLVAVSAGAALTVYVLQQSQLARRLAGLDPVVTAAPVVVQQPVQKTQSALQSVAMTTDLTRRVARTEQGIAQLAQRTTESSSNAERAEGLLVAFAARRALDRGVPLGYIEGLLRERFGGGQPQVVATILSASRQPVTLEELQSGLDDIAPTLLARGTDDSWWQGVRRELAGLVVVRRASAPSVAPIDRLTRARRQLEASHVDIALAEIARLPGRALAGSWIVRARRYVSARSALDIIETAALLAPHRPLLPEPTDVPESYTVPMPVLPNTPAVVTSGAPN